MQNIPLPNQAAMLSNTSASAAAAKAGKQANAANDGADFKQVLARQVKLEAKEAAATGQVLQRQRLQLQVQASDETQLLNPALVKLELDDGQEVQLEDALAIVEEVPQEVEAAALVAPEAMPVAMEGQPLLAAVAPDVQRKPVAKAVADELDTVDVKREPLEWGGKGKEPAPEVELNKTTIQAAQTAVPKAAAGAGAVIQFADALEQASQIPLAVAPSLQQPQLPQAAAALDVRGNQIPTPFGQPGWNQAIGQKVVWMAAGGEQTASLTLNPPDLGPLQVIIHVHNNQADTTFLSDQADVRRALEDGMDNLRQMMSQSGLQLGQSNVRSGQQEAQQQQAAGISRASVGDQGEEASQVLAKAARVMGLVDTFA
ncbi:flagellar hook-length control protein FliK [Methylobacillus arboreus]|uniref:flagellar hook-length control protein FliK n=1 Tax=Methylobacillus arboreus TaxID=755170 RepID=UPI001E47BC3B|nr:flagellar hook-length control protein FliK [Methylobacillus arboreus]MCB5189267.1 flagellar hook-length control protein FliK [Methylobacillus arboreus]